MVTDVISRLRTLGLYQDNDTKEVQLPLEDAVKNIIEEIHHIHSTPTAATYKKIYKLNHNIL